MRSAAEAFRDAFGDAPEVTVRSPGRVNLIGEHTDYNEGLVLPAAIDLGIELAAARRSDGRVRLASGGEMVEFGLQDSVSGWGAYAAGVLWALRAAGQPVTGFNGVIAASLPAGAGLSSSAALELAVARACCELTGSTWEPVTAAQACCRAENEYVGNRCGVMDQFAVALGQEGSALLLDCRSLAVEHVLVPANLAIVICDSARPRRLVESEFNRRRKECEEAALLLGLTALRDATGDMITRLPALLGIRVEHVIRENERVLGLAAALGSGDREEIGRLMAASHESLRDLFEVSCRELDLLVELAGELPGCLGSRLTGAGFGGCTVSLVEAGAAGEFAANLEERYCVRSGLPGRAYVCRASDGVRLIRP
ncbi:MAG: galactokinase [Chloroflexi bacterium]|nr:galactokinase [Chloroflexota bacterium]